MKTRTSKTIKFFAVFALAIGAILSSCKKGDTGPKGDTGAKGETGAPGAPGPAAKYYDFTMTFGSSSTVQTYNMQSGSMYGKITFVYMDKGTKEWVLLPYYRNTPGFVPVNFIGTCDELFEKIKVETLRGDNQAGSPWAAAAIDINFRAIVIEATKGRSADPDFDPADYNKMKIKYSLPD